MAQKGERPSQQNPIVPPEEGFINIDDLAKVEGIRGQAGDVPVPAHQSLPRPTQEGQTSGEQPTHDELMPTDVPGESAGLKLQQATQAELDAATAAKKAEEEEKARDKHTPIPQPEGVSLQEELVGASPESKPDNTHKFTQDDIKFMNHTVAQIAECHIRIADPQTRRTEIIRQLGFGFSHVEAVKRSDDPSEDLGLVFSAFGLGAAPNAEQSEGVAQQLRAAKQLSQEEMQNLLELNALAWRHKSNGVPDAVVASEIQNQVGGALSMLRQQQGHDLTSPSPYETALVAFATGVSASVPQLRMDEQLYKTLQANARSA